MLNVNLMGWDMELRVVTEYFKDGSKYCEWTENEEGQKYGTYQDWDENGQLHIQCEYVNGRIHGTYTRWHENGQLMEQSEYVNDIRHGLRYYWNTDGLLDYIQQRHNGELLVEVVYTYNGRERKVVVINIYGTSIETTGFVAGVVVKLKEEGRKFKIVHVNEL